MAQAVYRGVAYDTESRRQEQSQEKRIVLHSESYRGLKFTKIEVIKL